MLSLWLALSGEVCAEGAPDVAAAAQAGREAARTETRLTPLGIGVAAGLLAGPSLACSGALCVTGTVAVPCAVGGCILAAGGPAGAMALPDDPDPSLTADLSPQERAAFQEAYAQELRRQRLVWSSVGLAGSAVVTGAGALGLYVVAQSALQ